METRGEVILLRCGAVLRERAAPEPSYAISTLAWGLGYSTIKAWLESSLSITMTRSSSI